MNGHDKGPFEEQTRFCIITLDNAGVKKTTDVSRHGGTTSCVVQDRYTGWVDAYPSPWRTEEAIILARKHFIGPRGGSELLYFDNAREYLAAARSLQIRWNARGKNRPAANGVAERAVRRMLKGTRTILHDSGLPYCCCTEAATTYCANRSFHDLIRNTNKTPHQLRFGTEFNGTNIPFGALVAHLPTSTKDSKARGKFDPRTRRGIFVGYKIHTGGVQSRVYEVFDVQAFEESSEKARVTIHKA